MTESKKISGNSFNFGPSKSDNKSVRDILSILRKQWRGLKIKFVKDNNFTEHKLLQLSSLKAKKVLNWKSVLNFDETIKLTSEWYNALSKKQNMTKFTLDQIEYYKKKFHKVNNYRI